MMQEIRLEYNFVGHFQHDKSLIGKHLQNFKKGNYLNKSQTHYSSRFP